MGEPGGVGGEIAIKAWRALRADGPVFFLIDDPARIERLGAPVARIERPDQAPAMFGAALPVLALGIDVRAEAGRASPATAPAVERSIRMAVDFVMTGAAQAVVTNPIHKAAMIAGGFAYPGHTEFLGALTRSAGSPVMALVAPGLITVPVTVHLPLADVPRRLTSALIHGVGRIVAAALISDFAATNPRIAVAGLNPHAGEQGALGEEDARIIAPAVEALRAGGVDASGPLPADTLFHAEARARYDAALCMYHDQALIPVKTLAFHEAVNVTLGLPIIRTSPDHGVALDIAGAGAARADSLIAALRLAADMAARRAARRAGG